MWRRPVIAVKQAFVCDCSMVADNMAIKDNHYFRFQHVGELCFTFIGGN